MARIRSIKPEFWSDRKLARVSRDARLLYVALWNQADEHGRLQGDPRWIGGHCFPYDDDLGDAEIILLLKELESLGRVQRYEDSDGDPYLYLPKLAAHQRLEPGKSASRLPEPPPVAEPIDTPAAIVPDSAQIFPDESAPIVVQQVAGSRLHVAGGREHVAGLPPTAAPNEPASDPPGTTQTIIGEWIEHCRDRPPGQVIKRNGKAVAAMLAEGIDPDAVRRGLAAWQSKGLDPSVLPSVVNQVMNATVTPRRTSGLGVNFEQ